MNTLIQFANVTKRAGEVTAHCAPQAASVFDPIFVCEHLWDAGMHRPNLECAIVLAEKGKRNDSNYPNLNN